MSTVAGQYDIYLYELGFCDTDVGPLILNSLSSCNSPVRLRAYPSRVVFEYINEYTYIGFQKLVMKIPQWTPGCDSDSAVVDICVSISRGVEQS